MSLLSAPVLGLEHADDPRGAQQRRGLVGQAAHIVAGGGLLIQVSWRAPRCAR